VHRLAALAVLLVERVLEKLLGTLRHKTQVPRADAEASSFLRQVSEHKKQLIKTARKRAIYDD
jgi:hypothetical protein